jgi:hypothetical protein
MFGMLMLMSLWFAFDGFIGYPREKSRSAAYEQLEREVTEPKERLTRWRELAKSNGWSVDTPKEKANSFDNKIFGQYVFGGICLFVSLVPLYFYLTSKGRWVESTDEGLTTSWGQTVKFSDVVQLNKSRWTNKGIAKAYYKEGDQKKCFVFDDFKYERKPLGEILKQLEAVLKAEQIVGGTPEPNTLGEAPADDQNA